jgi:hypothetical protein
MELVLALGIGAAVVAAFLLGVYVESYEWKSVSSIPNLPAAETPPRSTPPPEYRIRDGYLEVGITDYEQVDPLVWRRLREATDEDAAELVST